MSVATAAQARVAASGGSLTRDEALAVLRVSGWPEWAIFDALSVARCESSLSPYAVNNGNYGLFQMNRTPRATIRGSWFVYWGLDDEAWSDPVTNATAALWTWQMLGWGPWSCKP